VNNQSINEKILDLSLCVIIPTYNNEGTLKRVIDGVLKYTQHIILVNDGATDSTSKILSNYSQLQQIHVEKNKGKGNSLRLAFKHAVTLNYQYAITIDSDGQHFPDDIPAFVNELEKSEDKNLLLIGARNMRQKDVPKKSSFGNTFSNFWFLVETGIKLQDTQSGFRLYPLKTIKKIKFYTSKFEFEIEVIVKSAWAGVTLKSIPVRVLYDETERVSHFRPFKDFTRISILNTWFVILAILYIKPRDFLRGFKKKGFKQFIKEDLLGTQKPSKKAFSVALGLFIGISPFLGFQTVLVFFLAYIFKLNKVIAFVFSNISLPPFIPFVLYASVKMGEYLLGVELKYTMEDMLDNFEILIHLKVYIIGSFLLAILVSASFGLLSYFLFLFSNKKVALNNG
jgi:glycosyltransferase involved in cell wall biosynthesis|tara:strand:+ start:750 stop:1940 length:1191 start_codon:yes stop_codon:yes gene_type:complete